MMNVEMFAQHIEAIHGRLSELYYSVNTSSAPPPDVLPIAFKELGTASEELQVALEELYQQNEELAAVREQLEAERQRYQELFEFAPDGYLVTDIYGTIQEANRAAATMLNVPQKHLNRKPLVIFLANEERQFFHTELNRQYLQNRPQEWVVRIQPRNGEPFDAALTMTAERTTGDKPTMLRWLLRDITERKRARAALNTVNYDPTEDRPLHFYAKGEFIPFKPQTIWLVHQGLVKLTTMSENCEEVMVGLIGSSMPFGADLTSLEIYQATALSDVQLASIRLSEISASPRLVQTLLPKISQRLRQTEAFLAISGQRRLKDRVHHLLRLLKKEIGEPVPEGTRLSVRLTHQDFANACCVTRVTITRMIGQLQRQGKISFDSKFHMIIKDEYF